MDFIETIITRVWNWAIARRRKRPRIRLLLGYIFENGQQTKKQAYLPHEVRTQHLAVLGKTGSGKSFELRFQTLQDIRADRGFAYFDHHGDTTPFLLGAVADEERRRRTDLSDRLIVIEPGDPQYSVGLNVLESTAGTPSFVQLSEFAAILKQRWHLDAFGARTEELLRSSLFVLADNHLTLLELAPLLTSAVFRTVALSRVSNSDIRAFFETRYDRASEAMQSMVRDAVLNKVSAFTADPSFRHVLGQQRSTFSLVEAIDRGCWIVLNLDKGRLGEQAATMGALFLTKIKNALFARNRRTLFTLYCDELQNLMSYDSGLDTLFSESRKFGIAVVSANQFLDQYPQQMRAAILSVASHVLFQLSATDADKMASALNGGRALAELLKNLPKRHFVLKTGHHRWIRASVPMVPKPSTPVADLYARCRSRWARQRIDIEAEIAARQRVAQQTAGEVLNDWE